MKGFGVSDAAMLGARCRENSESPVKRLLQIEF
jgi:hypothetical protein